MMGRPGQMMGPSPCRDVKDLQRQCCQFDGHNAAYHSLGQILAWSLCLCSGCYLNWDMGASAKVHEAYIVTCVNMTTYHIHYLGLHTNLAYKPNLPVMCLDALHLRISIITSNIPEFFTKIPESWIKFCPWHHGTFG